MAMVPSLLFARQEHIGAWSVVLRDLGAGLVCEVSDINGGQPIRSTKNEEQDFTLNSTRSQAKTGIICSLFLVPFSSLAFWTTWRRDKRHLRRPKYGALQ